MTQKIPILRRPSGNFDAVRDRRDLQAHRERVLEKLSHLELPGKEHFESYLHHKLRVNHKARTIDSAFTSIRFFLDFYGVLGKSNLNDIERSDLDAFIEHEQDRGLHISSARTRMATIIAFLHFLIEQDIIPQSCLQKRDQAQTP
jgi:site-specific recombinase XerD